MKTRTMFLSIGLTICVAANAQSQGKGISDTPFFPDPATVKAAKVQMIDRNYAWALSQENDGVVLAALAQVAYMGLYLPAGELGSVQAKVEELARSGRTEAIRHKAAVANNVLTSPERFSGERSQNFQDPDQLFSSLSGGLPQVYLLPAGNK